MNLLKENSIKILNKSNCLINCFVLALVVTFVFLCGCVLFSGCAYEANKRLQKDTLSESEGLNRTLEVYSADGKLLKTYKGKFDIETSEGGKIKFDIGNKRTILYNATVICDEVED